MKRYYEEERHESYNAENDNDLQVVVVDRV